MYVTESQVIQHLPVPECVEVLRNAFSKRFVNIPRYRLKSQNSLLHVMSASIPEMDIMGLKAYGTSRSGGSFAVLLYQESTGTLLAVFEADALGQIRTGAASGLASDFLASPVAENGCIIGTGFQAETQLLAMDAVRTLKQIRIYSRSTERRKEFVRKMQSRVRAELIDSASAEESVRNADLITTITSSKQPVLNGEWIKQGCHVNAAGSNWAEKAEIDPIAVQRASLICVDHKEQAKIESGDLIQAIHDSSGWDKIRELSEVVQGKFRRESPTQITLFKSNGIAMEDIAAAFHIYAKLKAESFPHESHHS